MGDQGLVITRRRNGLAHSPHNTSIQSVHGVESWYRVQTNWDNWMPITQDECKGTAASLPPFAAQACNVLTKLAFGDPRGCAVLCNMTSDGRREAAVQAMDELTTRHVSFRSIFDVLSKPPVLAKNTQFTTLMRPATDEYRTTVRMHGGHSAQSASAGRPL